MFLPKIPFGKIGYREFDIACVQKLSVTEGNLRLHRQWLGRKTEVWWLFLDLKKLYYYNSLLSLLLLSERKLQYPLQLLFLLLPHSLLFRLSSCGELHGKAEVCFGAGGRGGAGCTGSVSKFH